MNRKALGRGLSALLGEDSTNQTGEEGLIEIDLDLITPNAEQPRTRFTEANLEELAQSIRVNGVVQPILVRKKGTGYELIAGERRWRASAPRWPIVTVLFFNVRGGTIRGAAAGNGIRGFWACAS